MLPSFFKNNEDHVQRDQPYIDFILISSFVLQKLLLVQCLTNNFEPRKKKKTSRHYDNGKR